MKAHIFNKVGGRKAGLALLAYLGTFILTAVGILPPDGYQYVTGLLILFYIAGNVAQKATAKTPKDLEQVDD